MRQKVVRWLIVSVAALVPLCLLLFFGWSFFASRALMRELASIRADGEPLSLQDLHLVEKEIDDGDNAAGLYESSLSLLAESDPEALQKLRRLYDARAARWPLEPPEEAVSVRVERLLQSNSKALGLLDQAASLEECRYAVPVLQEDYLESIRELRSLAELSLLRIFDRAPLVHFMVTTPYRKG